MGEETARFGLPFILPGQAQKEVFHNEALARIDALLHPTVEGGTLASPPAAPGPGQCWIVAAGPTGAWEGMDGRIAAWTEGGWRFAAPVPGMSVWDKAAGYWRCWNGAAWSDGLLPAAGLAVAGVQVVGARHPSILSPSSGTVIDAEARAAVTEIIDALRSHGLIE